MFFPAARVLSAVIAAFLTTQATLARPSPNPAAHNVNEDLVTRQEEPVDFYVLNWRVFGATGCFEKNWGVGTVTASQLDKCIPFFDDGIKAINLTHIIDGCSFHVYTGVDCDGQSLDLKMGRQCGGNIPDESLSWRSTKATCP
ncbi:hypothetical protein V8F20_011252 [Naviculisporaceae sp. PSN 640]